MVLCVPVLQLAAAKKLLLCKSEGQHGSLQRCPVHMLGKMIAQARLALPTPLWSMHLHTYQCLFQCTACGVRLPVTNPVVSSIRSVML